MGSQVRANFLRTANVARGSDPPESANFANFCEPICSQSSQVSLRSLFLAKGWE